jgi:hypothetical protein
MAFIFITDGMVFTGGLELGCFGPGGAAEIATDDRLFKLGELADCRVRFIVFGR